MPNNRPDPESSYLSKYLVDFNKRELDKFFHPQKNAKVMLSVAALGIIAFFFIATISPLKNSFFNKQYEKSPASAAIPEIAPQVALHGPQTVKKGERFTVILSVRSDSKVITNITGDISYPKQKMILMIAEPDNNQFLTEQATDQQNGMSNFKAQFPTNWKTNGADQNLIKLNFKALDAGEAAVTLDKVYLKNDQEEYSVTPSNYSVLITE